MSSEVHWSPAYAGIPTFMSCELWHPECTADVTVLGIPFDSGSTSFRTGSRFGPRKLREASLLMWGYNARLCVSPLEALRVVDCGDVAIVPGDTDESIRRIEARAEELIASSRLLALGGDHTISLPLLRAHARRYGPLAVLHLDAHSDLWKGRIDHGTSYGYALNEGLLDQTAYVQVGIRGPVCSAEDASAGVRCGALVITAEDVHANSLDFTIQRVRERLTGKAVYISLDLDVADPACAPGVGTPEIGGLTSQHLLSILRGLRGMNIVGMDIVELTPSYDSSEITAILAANLAFEGLSLMALREENL